MATTSMAAGSGTGSGIVGGTEKVATRKLIGSIPDLPEASRPCSRGKDLPKLVQVQEWRSKRERPRESITLMTHLSADR